MTAAPQKKILKFPNKFFWGTATAAFQIEGHPEESLAKLSDWSEWLETPGKISGSTNNGRAVDHYQHMLEDVSLIRGLNNNSYRFSFNWARLHRGPGQFDENTLQFYKNLLDQLEGKGEQGKPDSWKPRIEPFATLVHFVLPNWLAKDGGWENPNTAFQFGQFTQYLMDHFGDRIKYWITHNEPNIFLNFGYESGIWPPGHANEWGRYFKAYQGLVLGHQIAYSTIKENRADAQVGFSQNLYSFEAYDAVMQKMKTNTTLLEEFMHIDLMPNLIRNQLHNHMFIESCVDMDALDFLGVNYYTRFSYKLNPEAKDPANPNIDSSLWGELQDLAQQFPDEIKTNSLNWEVYPEGLEKVLTNKKLKRILGDRPIFITENGYSHVEGKPGSYAQALKTEDNDFNKDINDTYRKHYLRDHLISCHKAINAGVNLKGYFYWSLLDNFEWALGMEPRFGLIHVDHETFERTPKASYHYYSEIAKNNGLAFTLPELEPATEEPNEEDALVLAPIAEEPKPIPEMKIIPLNKESEE